MAEVTIEMDINEKNVLALQKYEELVQHWNMTVTGDDFSSSDDSIDELVLKVDIMF